MTVGTLPHELFRQPELVGYLLYTHSDSGKKTLRYIGHNDTNQEDDSVQPVVTQDEGNDEECHSQEHSHTWEMKM